MDTYEQWTLLLGGLAVAINLVLLAFVALQLSYLRRQIQQAQESTDLDHARRRAQATIDFYASTLATRSQFRARLPFDRDRDAVAEFTAGAKEDPQITKELADYLGMWELFATAANTGVIDRDIVNLIGGGRIRAIASNYRSWINWRRERTGTESLYCELSELSDSLPPHNESRATIRKAVEG